MPNSKLQKTENLRRIWNKKKGEMQFTQVTAAKALDWTQGAISHYLNNVVPLGPTAVLKFANFLGVDPTEIDPDYVNHLPDVTVHSIKYATNNMSKKLDETVTTHADPNSFWVRLAEGTKIYRDSKVHQVRAWPTWPKEATYAKVYESRKPERRLMLVRLKNQQGAHVYHASALPPSNTISKLYNILRVVHEVQEI